MCVNENFHSVREMICVLPKFTYNYLVFTPGVAPNVNLPHNETALHNIGERQVVEFLAVYTGVVSES